MNQIRGIDPFGLNQNKCFGGFNVFMLFLLACSVEIPDLMFENKGAGQIWIGGKHTEDLNNQNVDNELPNDTATADSGLEDSGIEDSGIEE